jgi:hypothetical protein
VARILADKSDWHPLDAVVFPGGYLRLTRFVGRMSHRERCRSIVREPFGPRLTAASGLLATATGGARLVIGLDSSSPYYGDYGDELCVALCGARVVGIARKIFPTDHDTRGRIRFIVPAIADFGS